MIFVSEINWIALPFPASYRTSGERPRSHAPIVETTRDAAPAPSGKLCLCCGNDPNPCRRHGDDRPHQFKQNPYPSPVVKGGQFPHRTGKWTSDDPNLLTLLQPRSNGDHTVCVSDFHQPLDNVVWNRPRPIPVHEQMRDTECPVHAPPTIPPNRQLDKQVTREKRRLLGSELPSMPNCLPAERQERAKPLVGEMNDGPRFPVRLCIHRVPARSAYLRVEVI